MPILPPLVAPGPVAKTTMVAATHYKAIWALPQCKGLTTVLSFIMWIPYLESPSLYWAWWRHQMEAFSVLLAFCAGNSPLTGEFPAQRSVTRNFDVFFDLRPNQQLRRQWRRWWFETLPRSIWRHCNGQGSVRMMALTWQIVPGSRLGLIKADLGLFMVHLETWVVHLLYLIKLAHGQASAGESWGNSTNVSFTVNILFFFCWV